MTDSMCIAALVLSVVKLRKYLSNLYQISLSVIRDLYKTLDYQLDRIIRYKIFSGVHYR